MEQSNRREFLRARVSMSAKCQILEGEDVELVKQGLGVTLFRGGDTPDPIEAFMGTMPSGTQNEILYQCFKALNNKLDFLIEQLSFPDVQKASNFKEIVEISGSGIKFLSLDPIPEGSFLKIELIMPSTVQFRVELIAEVLRMEKREDRNAYLVAARILDIEETARDAIIEAVFRKQRKVIRKQKELQKKQRENQGE